jgi:small-conductance mechanosensitive channel
MAKDRIFKTILSLITFADQLQEQVMAQKGEVGTALLNLAREHRDPDAFLVACKAAEDDRKANLNRVAQEKAWSVEELREHSRLPDAYRQAKSNVKKVWEEFGKHPKEFKTISEVNRYLNDARKSKNSNTRTDEPNKGATEGATRAMAAMQGSISSVLFGDMLKRHDKLMAHINKLPSDKQETIAEKYEEMLDTLELMVELAGGDTSDSPAEEATAVAAH